jgi:hypothetical protein
MKLDTIPNDSATTISRNRVSFNMCKSEDKDRSSLAKLSTIFAKKISNASNVKVNGKFHFYKNNRMYRIAKNSGNSQK